MQFLLQAVQTGAGAVSPIGVRQISFGTGEDLVKLHGSTPALGTAAGHGEMLGRFVQSLAVARVVFEVIV